LQWNFKTHLQIYNTFNYIIMKASEILVLTSLLFWSFDTCPQQFWSLTNEFWGGPKTGITLIDDSVLIAGTTTGVLKSTNEGNHFEQVLTASAVHTVFASSQGDIFAGGKGKIYVSNDSSASWDSAAVNSEYPVKQIIENKYGALFAITGEYDQGDGVFYSEDNGKTWETRNNGLGVLKGCVRIASDKNGRLYLTISDEKSTGSGGLFISETYGLLWEKVSIKLDSLNGPLKITIPTGLSISPGDSVYFSFYGIATNLMVQLNLNKSIDDIPLGNSWRAFHVNKSSKWWEDRPLNNIHFSQKGDLYSSYTELANNGATYFLASGEKNWNRIDYGLGLSEDGWRYTQHFAENSHGRIFMVQYLDERIYTTEKSLLTDINPPIRNPLAIQVYPNPVKIGGNLTVQLPMAGGSVELSLYNLTGRKVLSNFITNNSIEITAPLKTGLYILAIKYQNAIVHEKILVI
jgi:hypothetical protein